MKKSFGTLTALISASAALASGQVQSPEAGASAGAPPSQTMMATTRGQRPIDTKLFEAIRAGDAARVKTLLKKGADANANEANGWRPLINACMAQSASLEIVMALVTHGAKVNYRQPDQGLTALMECFNGQPHIDVAKYLIAKGAQVNSSAPNGDTALSMAVRCGDPGGVSLLLSHGASVHIRSKPAPGETVIEQAMIHYSEPGFKMSGRPPLFELVNHWNDRVYALLIRAGADLHEKDDNGWTALHWAVYGGDPSVVKKLISKGLNPNEPSKQGFTPVHIAMHTLSHGADPGLLDALSSAGANLQAKNQLGQTPETILRSDDDYFMHLYFVSHPNEMMRNWLASQNKLLKELNPTAAPIAFPSPQLGVWEELADGPKGMKKRITLEGGQAKLELRIDASKDPLDIQLSDIYLDDYERLDPTPVHVKVPAGERFDAAFQFPAEAAKAGAVRFEYKIDGTWEGTFTQGVPYSISFSATSENAPQSVSVCNMDGGRSLEIQVIGVEVDNKPLDTSKSGSLVVKPEGVFSVAQFMPKKATSCILRYRWRLLPNKRWTEDKYTWHSG